MDHYRIVEIVERNRVELCKHDETKEKVTAATTAKNGKITQNCKECKEIVFTYTIYKASTVKLSKATKIYNGKVKNPTIIIKESMGNKISSEYYTVTKPSGKNVGKVE